MPRRVKTVIDDHVVRLHTLLERASRLGPIRTRFGSNGERYAYRVASWQGNFAGGKVGEIVCVPSLRPVAGASPPRWEVDLENSMVLYGPAGMPAMRAVISY